MIDDTGPDIALVQRIPVVPSILSVCASMTGVGIAVVARVTQDRWTAAATLDQVGFGLHPGQELPIETTFCQTVRDSGEPVIFDDAPADEVWRHSPIPAMYGIACYIAVPIRLPDGTFWGTLCGFDPEPRPVSRADTVRSFQLFADLLGFHIDAQRRLEASEGLVAEMRQDSTLREQYIAVLGHDLRNPLAAIGAGVRFLRREPLGERGRAVLELMDGSLDRMGSLVDEALDFARGRLAGGIPLAMMDEVDLRPILGQIVAEMRSVWPDRAIEADLRELGPLRADPRRIGQMLSNLLGNALAHGSAERAVRVVAKTEDGAMSLCVENGGRPIPPQVLADLFEPFKRQPDRFRDTGLGLGLYIAAQIARAHGGELVAQSDEQETRLTFRMPVAAQARSQVAV